MNVGSRSTRAPTRGEIDPTKGTHQRQNTGPLRRLPFTASVYLPPAPNTTTVLANFIPSQPPVQQRAEEPPPMRLAIADPPYPPLRAAHARNDSSRAQRWYAPDYRKTGDATHASDHHEDAAEWDDPARHRALMLQLEQDYDGWAIATAHDGIPAYGELPRRARIMIWNKTNAPATASRIRNVWEPVIVRLPDTRMSSRLMGGQLPDLLVAAAPRIGFAGAKPAAWTRWVLDALGYDPETDTVDDLFPGSGSVAAAISQGVLL